MVLQNINCYDVSVYTIPQFQQKVYIFFIFSFFQVTLMLLDQNNREHIIDAFRPDISSTSFQRPISEMNIASGCPLFCPLAKLAGKSSYVRDDTIFIKAIVDLTGL